MTAQQRVTRTYALKRSTPRSFAWECLACGDGTVVNRREFAQPTRSAAQQLARSHRRTCTLVAA